ncbi:GNAT family N-acetyltransferase [Novosphingopyxis sp.]|uniref:GNAT family N-acetyltransferase n=1 Tax=Novosphingopyxis sp. TaxID=2709690 RepID=UPI003B5BE588
MQAYKNAVASPPNLYTSSLVLRRPSEQDIPAIVTIAGDWEVASRLARMPHPYGEEEARFFLDVIVPAELAWAIVDRTCGNLLGVIGLAPNEYEGAELGYYISRQHWGCGIATEAASVVAAYGAGLVGQDRLISTFFADNPASGRVLEKLGFVKQGSSKETCLATGGAKTAVKMGLASTTVLEGFE